MTPRVSNMRATIPMLVAMPKKEDYIHAKTQAVPLYSKLEKSGLALSCHIYIYIYMYMHPYDNIDTGETTCPAYVSQKNIARAKHCFTKHQQGCSQQDARFPRQEIDATHLLEVDKTLVLRARTNLLQRNTSLCARPLIYRNNILFS